MTPADEWRDDDVVGLTPLGWAVSDVPWGDDEPGAVGDDGADDQGEEEEHRGRDDED